MTKQEVKDLCEDDDKLQWWAMVLFAEICELVQTIDNAYGGDPQTLTKMVRGKVQEFPRLVIQRQLEKAKENREKEQAYVGE